jgi:hypothetical protein
MDEIDGVLLRACVVDIVMGEVDVGVGEGANRRLETP